MGGTEGFADEVLARIDGIVARAVQQRDAPGVVAAVARGAAIHVATAGVMAVEGPPMRRDTLFRIASITKPMTAAVVLSLADQGLLDLDEPVDRLLPELADRRVLRHTDGPLEDTVPARRHQLQARWRTPRSPPPAAHMKGATQPLDCIPGR